MEEKIVKEIQITKMALTRAMRARDKERVRACQAKLISLEMNYREIQKRAK